MMKKQEEEKHQLECMQSQWWIWRQQNKQANGCDVKSTCLSFFCFCLFKKQDLFNVHHVASRCVSPTLRDTSLHRWLGKTLPPRSNQWTKPGTIALFLSRGFFFFKPALMGFFFVGLQRLDRRGSCCCSRCSPSSFCATMHSQRDLRQWMRRCASSGVSSTLAGSSRKNTRTHVYLLTSSSWFFFGAPPHPSHVSVHLRSGRAAHSAVCTHRRVRCTLCLPDHLVEHQLLAAHLHSRLAQADINSFAMQSVA